MSWCSITCTCNPWFLFRRKALGCLSVDVWGRRGVREVLSHDALFISVANPHDVPVWNQMASIKSNILKRWDTGPAGVRICCIKFVQKIIQVQTPGVIPDPRVRDLHHMASVLCLLIYVYSDPSTTRSPSL